MLQGTQATAEELEESSCLPIGCRSQHSATVARQETPATAEKKPAYNCQGAVSEDGIIVAAYATNKANDKEQLQEVINQVEANVAEKTGVILADSGYSSYENYQWLSEQGKTAYIPDQEEQASKERLQDPYDKQHLPINQPLTNTSVRKAKY